MTRLLRRMNIRLIGILILVGALVGCKPDAPVFAPPPPAVVTVARPLAVSVPRTIEFNGFVEPFQQVEMRARVRGFIEKRLVNGGDRVKEGQLLFTIDPRPFKASVDQARAETRSKQAQLRIAEINLQRRKEALAGNAATQFEVDQATATRDQAAAELALTQAQLATAELDLSYTEIRAPFDGRISLRLPEVGDLVGMDSAVLFTIVDTSKVYAVYTADENIVNILRHARDQRIAHGDFNQSHTVLLAQEGDVGYPNVGTFAGADNQIESGTGSITLRAIYDNPNEKIINGSYVRLQALLGSENVLLVPEVAMLFDQSGRFVYVVNDQNVVEMRRIEVADVIEGFRKVRSGLTTDDRVIVNGIQRVHPTAVVAPEETTLKPPTIPTHPTTQASNDASTKPTTRSTRRER